LQWRERTGRGGVYVGGKREGTAKKLEGQKPVRKEMKNGREEGAKGGTVGNS